MKIKSFGIIFSVIALLIFVEMVFYNAVIFIEFILFEGSWGGNIIDAFCLLFNVIFYIMLSVTLYALIFPKIIKSCNLNKNAVIIILFIVCIMISIYEGAIITGLLDFSSFGFIDNGVAFKLLAADELPTGMKTGRYFIVFILNMIKPIALFAALKKK